MRQQVDEGRPVRDDGGCDTNPAPDGLGHAILPTGARALPVWDHSHEEDYITEATVEGARQHRPWKSDISTPDLTAHLAGER